MHNLLNFEFKFCSVKTQMWRDSAIIWIVQKPLLKIFPLMVKDIRYEIHVLASCSHGSNLIFPSYLRILGRAEGRAKAGKGGILISGPFEDHLLGWSYRDPLEWVAYAFWGHTWCCVTVFYLMGKTQAVDIYYLSPIIEVYVCIFM